MVLRLVSYAEQRLLYCFLLPDPHGTSVAVPSTTIPCVTRGRCPGPRVEGVGNAITTLGHPEPYVLETDRGQEENGLGSVLRLD